MSNQSTFSTTMIILALVGLAVGGGGGYMISNNSLKPKINELETNVEALNSEVSSLTTTITSLEKELEESETEVESLEGDISNYQSEVSSLITEKSSLQTLVTNLQSQVLSITDENTELQSQISTLESDLDEAEDDITALEHQVASKEARILSLQNRLAVTPNYYRCEIFGFSFEYPSSYHIRIDDLSGNPVTGNLGNAYITNADESDVYVCTWLYTPSTPDLEASLDGGFEGLQAYNLVLGTRESYILNEHIVRYQNYTITEGSTTNYGINAVFYCEESNYFYLIQHLSESTDVSTGFYQFINTMRCHNPPIF